MKRPSTLTFFTQTGAISLSIKHLLKDTSTLNQYKTIVEYAKAQGLSVEKQALLKLRDLIESDLKQNCEEHAFVIYKLFELGGLGNENDYSFRHAMATWLLQLEPHSDLDVSALPEFVTQLQNGYDRFKLSNTSLSSVQHRFEQFKPTVVGISFELLHQNRLNRLLQFVGSKLRIYVKQYKQNVSAVLGFATEKKIGIYTILIFTKELIRTPNFVMTNAANVLDTSIMVRHDSLNAVFAFKWQSIFENHYSDWRLSADPYWNISYAIKSEAVARYRAGFNTLPETKAHLISEMEEGIIFHEIGHTVVQEMFLPIESICVGLGTLYYEEKFYDALYELLADFAPKHNLGLGAMANLVKISKTDRAKAERMFYTYMSDIWFFDTDDRDMWTYSTIVSLCMLRYIQPDRSINFDLIKADVSIKKDGTKSGSLIDLIKSIFISDTEILADRIKAIRFQISGGDYSFQHIVSDRISQWRKRHPGASQDEYTFLQPLWHNMYSYIHHFTQEEAQIKSLIQTLTEQSMFKILEFTAGSADAARYRLMPRQYIVDRCFKIGLVHDKAGSRQIIE